MPNNGTVVVGPGLVVVVVDDNPVVLGAVVVVVLDVVVLDELVVLVVEAGAVVDVVVVVLVAGGGLKRFLRVGPLPVLPKIEASGLLAINSIAVTNPIASTNTIAAVPAMTFQLNLRPPGCRAAPATPPSPVGGTGGTGGTRVVDACRCSVDGASATAEISNFRVSSAEAPPDSIWVVLSPSLATTSVGAAAPASPEDCAVPAVRVPPRRRSSGEVDACGTRTTTCLTALCPRSIDCEMSADPIVAATEPMATPMIVPVTPKLDAISAASTAPAAEARICRKENFTPTKRIRRGRAPLPWR